MRNRVRLLTLFAASAGTFALVLTAAASRRVGAVTAALVLAVAWAAAISVADAVMVWRAPVPRPNPSTGSMPRTPLTFVVRLGEERRDIARTSILLAAQCGTVHVVSTRHHDVLGELGDVAITEHVAPTIQAAVQDAANAITTDAVLLISAGAFPVGVSCEAAAAQVTGDVGWIIGSVPTFNHDRYAPRERELLSVRVRSAARGLGLVTWEPDATIVRTSLIRDHPLDPARPDGRWLRARAAEGYRGLVYPEAVAVQAAPADAPVFWPMRTRRQRGVVADLADAMTTGPLRTRALAGAALLRELFAYPMLLWLLAIVLIGRSGEFPLRMAPWAFFAMQGAVAGSRWMSSRTAYGIGLHPVEDARAAAYDLPGSLLALPTALTRRVRRARLPLPDQPLLWLALAITLLATAPLVDRRAETSSTIGVAVGLTLAALATTWVFAMRAFGARGWDRASYRLALDRSATINGRPARTVDASPSGLALAGAPEGLAPGDHVSLSIAFDDASVTRLRGRVADRRTTRGRTSVGIALDLSPDERVRWVRRLFSAAGITGRVPTFPEPRVPRRPLALEREHAPRRRAILVMVPTAVVVAVSVLVAGALVLAFLGYRPMVERSGSMVPTLRVGDVVVAEWVHADRIRPGEIVTFPEAIGRTELVTHRVRSVRVEGDSVRVVTKGDANADPERWSAGRSTLVGRVVWRVPRLGFLLTSLGATWFRHLLLAVVAAGVLAGGCVAFARRRGAVTSGGAGVPVRAR